MIESLQEQIDLLERQIYGIPIDDYESEHSFLLVFAGIDMGDDLAGDQFSRAEQDRSNPIFGADHSLLPPPAGVVEEQPCVFYGEEKWDNGGGTPRAMKDLAALL